MPYLNTDPVEYARRLMRTSNSSPMPEFQLPQQQQQQQMIAAPQDQGSPEDMMGLNNIPSGSAPANQNINRITPIESTDLAQFSRQEPMKADYHPSKTRNVLSHIGGMISGMGAQDAKVGRETYQNLRDAPYNKQHQQWEQGLNMRDRALQIAQANETNLNKQAMDRANIQHLGAESDAERGRVRQEDATATLRTAQAAHLNDPEWDVKSVPESGGYISYNKKDGKAIFTNIQGVTRPATQMEIEIMRENAANKRNEDTNKTRLTLGAMLAGSKHEGLEAKKKDPKKMTEAEKTSALKLTVERIRQEHPEWSGFFYKDPKHPGLWGTKVPEGGITWLGEKLGFSHAHEEYNKLQATIKEEYEKEIGSIPEPTLDENKRKFLENFAITVEP